MSRGPLAGIAVVSSLVAGAPPLVGQAAGSLGLAASIVEYDGFLVSGAAVVAPAFRFDASRFALAGQGNWTRFESGNEVFQGTGAMAWLIGSRERWRLELSGSAGASKYAAEPATGYAIAGARMHVFGAGTGGWAGMTVGRALGGPAAAPVEVAVAGWTVRRRLTMVGTATATWFGRDRYLDLLGVARWVSSRVELEARVGARPWVRAGEDAGDPIAGGYAEVTALLPVGRRLAVSVGGGSYPSDPVRRVIGAKYLNAGVRLRIFGQAAPTVAGSAAPVVERRLVPDSTGPARLETAGSGPLRTIRVRAPGAAQVELAGDFTDWTPVALAQVAPGVWAVQLPLAPGIYRVNVRLDGGAWLAPGGTRPERGEFGGAVGILVVP